MELRTRLDGVLDRWNLLEHPFYRAWSAGTLPEEALRRYATEYGAFIGTLSHGWTTLDDPETAREEQEHAGLWAEFAASLDAPAGEPRIEETRALVGASRDLFETPAGALGALYAFEAQQPATARSKREGLEAHYRLPQREGSYFAVHSENWHETEKILARLSRLSPEAQEGSVRACERMAEALWNALSGIHRESGCD